MMKIQNKKRGQIWISAVMYILIISTSLLVVLKFGIPLINDIKDQNSFQKTKNVMISLDEQITHVANEGEGSQRIISLDITEGNLLVEDDQIIWEFETDSEILDERSLQTTGNLKILSNANVKTYENSNNYHLSTIVDYKNNNQPIRFNTTIQKLGSKTNWVQINTSELIQNMMYDSTQSTGEFNIFLNNDPQTGIGNGYTYMIPEGNNTNLGKATIVAHINSSTSSPHIEYDLHITLNSYSDFLEIETKNIQIT